MKEFLYLTTPIDTPLIYRGYPLENKLYIRNPDAKTVISYYDDKTPVAK